MYPTPTLKSLIRPGILTIIFMAVLMCISVVISHAQTTISGTITSDKGKAVRGASVYLDNTIDGGTTDSMGVFHFTTSEKGNQTIVTSCMGYENAGMPIVINGDMSGIVLRMKTVNTLGEVTITAGSFDASNGSKTTLRPLDIVTTAGANADVVKAIETLPGTQQTGTENGLFVRGGDASEASILVDEMVVQNAFFNSAPGVATRSRFGAFDFQGVSFSSGGYSARYGQALSGVLELSTTDLPDKSNVNIGLNMAGIYASGTKLWKNNMSLDIGGSYNNLTPFYGLAATNFKFYDVPIAESYNMRYMWKPNKNGILKVMANGSHLTSGIAVPNPYAYDTIASDAALRNMGDTVNYHTTDQNYYSNVSYKQMWKNKYSLYTAASYSYDNTKGLLGTAPITDIEQRTQFRIEGKDFVNTRFSLLLGGELQNYGIKKGFDTLNDQFTETQLAGYAEADWAPFYWFSLRPGLRLEHSALLNQTALAPRLSMAFRTGKYSQISLATGIFYQDPANAYLLAGYRPNFQRAEHYIANWQYTRDDRTLRVEGYYKNYADLIREPFITPYDPNYYRFVTDTEHVNNSGYGYAEGFELFWRDKKTFKNVDYWISYSYIDTKRLYENYLAEATPDFISNHNLNVVAKYYVDKISTNFSATYTFASGRPYYDPTPGVAFLSERTPDFNNLALTVSYLHTFGKWFTVFYVSIDNITNSHNIFGYRYSYDGSQRYPELPALYRSIFVGVNMSLTQFKKDEL